jgi:hypothetical protein
VFDDKTNHEVVHIPISKDKGEKEYYVLDIAGLQNGQYRPVLPYKTYQEVNDRDTLGKNQLGHREPEDREKASDHPRSLLQMLLKTTDALNATVEFWEDAHKKLVLKVLTQEEAAYETDKNSIVALIRQALQHQTKQMHARRAAEEELKTGGAQGATRLLAAFE